MQQRMVYSLPVGCVVRTRDVLQNAHTVITFILWEVCLHCSPVCKTRLTNGSTVIQLWRALEDVKMRTAIRRPFVGKLFPFEHGFMSWKCLRAEIIYIYYILSILRCRHFPHFSIWNQAFYNLLKSRWPWLFLLIRLHLRNGIVVCWV